MGSEWKEIPFNELGEVNRGRSRHRPRYAEHLYGGPYPFIQTGDVRESGGRITTHTQTYSEAGLEQSRLWPEGTMCITIAANIAETGILTYPACFPDSVVGFIADENICDVRFVEYNFRLLKRRLQSEAIGSVQDNINLATLARLNIPLPPLPEQKAIAHILGTLDDKIELNRRMNATLEGMAQALFKSWFVDFDPVIDNALAAGNPIPDELAPRAEVRKNALQSKEPSVSAEASAKAGFPSAFQFTDELGWIPEGWEMRKIGDFARIKHGYAFKGEYFSAEETEDILVTPGNFRIGGGFKSDKLKFYDGPIDDDYVLDANDLIVTMTDLSKAGDTLGYPAFVPPSARFTYHHNQRIGLVNIVSQGIGKNLLYQIFRSAAYRDEILGSMSGSTVKHTSPSKIEAFAFAFAGGEPEQQFEDVNRAIEVKITANNSATETLTKLRDTLLPKLISGELTIKQGTQLVENSL